MTTWTLVYEGFDRQGEGLRESLCALGNGRFCTRGAAEFADADEVHYPGTYLAGGYNRLTTEIAGRLVENEDLVNLPNWLCLTFRIEDGDWFDLAKVEILTYHQELDVREGVLRRAIRFREGEGRETLLASRRIVSMAHPNLAAIEWTVTAENWSGKVRLRSALDGRVVNAGVERYRQLNHRHLEPVDQGRVGDDGICLLVRTSQSHIRLAEAARTRIYHDGERLQAETETRLEEGYAAQELSFEVGLGSPVRIEKIVALSSSLDRAISEPCLAACTAVQRAGDFDDLLRRHRLVWGQLWRRCDMVLGNDERLQMILHVHIFHLLQTTSWNTLDLDAGVPARGLHGEAYRGHIFWDELFIFPFLDFRLPEVTHSLLLYRHRRLDEARANARAAGHRGAMYPWQSGSDGREETQPMHLNPRSGRWLPDFSHNQRHVNIAVAYNLWQYYQATTHRGFTAIYGFEMLFEIARFWASLATYNPERDRYEIVGVMGPDEYHDRYPGAPEPGLRNNAYTNVMVSWLLHAALAALDILLEDRRNELREILDLGDEEISLWTDISHKMFVPFHDDGIISQFEGYEDLEEFDWDGYRERYGDIRRLDRILEAEGDATNRYKVSKQADVLMLFYLLSEHELREVFERLGYPFDENTIPRNIDYYIRRTSHGSTLSAVVHSAVTARYDRSNSWRIFCEALESDFRDSQGGTTAEGIHLGAMAGTVDLLQRCYTGLHVRADTLFFNPMLPDELDVLEFCVHYRGMWMDVRLTHEKLTLSARPTGPETVKVGIGDRSYFLKPGYAREFPL